MKFAEALAKQQAGTLYVRRPLLNADAVVSWAKRQGFATTLAPGEMHATIAYSKVLVDWERIRPRRDTLTAWEGYRTVTPLGDDGAIVLKFESAALHDRWQELRDAGAVWSYPTYQPHVTISYNGDGVDLRNVIPFSEPLVFGPEIHEPIKQGWKSTITEKNMGIITGADVLDFLKDHAPDVAALVEKNLTVGDVHKPTTGGQNDNDGKDKGKGKFATLIEQASAAGTLPKRKDEEVEKTEWSLPFVVAKAEPEQRLIFGWASIVEKDGKVIIDKQGHAIEAAELENAAYDFVLYYRDGSDMHEVMKTSRLVESMVFTKEKQDLMGIDLGLVGWWTGFKVDNDELWALHKAGKRPEFSIGGTAVLVPL